MRHSVSVSNPYPDLISTVVTPSSSRDINRGFGGFKQCFLRGISGSLDGRKDPSPGFGQLLVTCSFEPHFKFTRTVPRINQMSMAVDQSRGDAHSLSIPDLTGQGFRGSWKLGSGSDPGNCSVLNGDCPVFDQTIRGSPLFMQASFTECQSRSQFCEGVIPEFQ